MDELGEVETDGVTLVADPVMEITVPEPEHKETLYRCKSCKSLLLGREDARDHLHWHSSLLHIRR